MISAAVGLAVCALSVWAMFRWCADVLTFLRGLLPLGFFLAGVAAVVTGLSTLKRPAKADGEKKSGS